MNKNTKIIFFDIDGTIYNSGKGVPDDTCDAIVKLKENGHIPVICTGRSRKMVYSEHLAPGFNYIVSGAGTNIEINGESKYLYEMESADAKEMFNELMENDFLPVGEGYADIFLGNNKSILTGKYRECLEKYYQEEIADDLIIYTNQEMHISKVSALYSATSNEEAIIERYKDKYTFVNHNGHILEMIPKPFSKATGIEKLIEYLGIDRENTYAFGDSFNDIDMLKYVKYGCAMGNANEELKAEVPFVTKDYDKGGILGALKKFNLI